MLHMHTHSILFIDSCHPQLAQALTTIGVHCDYDYTSSKEEIIAKLSHYTGLVIRSRFKLDADFLKHCTPFSQVLSPSASLVSVYSRSLQLR
ncbi:MAG: hypothetical protein H7331_00630 [Bacteroidia bacterium]|nr:hypothetical protein [Bacteroidia bacterium]